ncbi:hypothetical protein MLGJGCBP_03952 [Rhodococcus sp. T7]|nr:hypothetical protein MLGJGCBP_03952 [Rhodococcus sp. T7]
MQVGVRRRHPGAVLGRVDLEPPRPVEHRSAAVERDGRQTDRCGGVEDRTAARIVRWDVAQPHRTAATVAVTGGVVVLQPADIRQDVARTPPRRTHRLPVVEHLGRRPERDTRIVRRAPAEDLGPGVPHETVAPLLRLDRIVPVVPGVEQVHPLGQLEDVAVPDVRRAGLQQAHRHRRILAQPCREDAPRATATRDHVVEFQCSAPQFTFGHRASSLSIGSDCGAAGAAAAECDVRVPMWCLPVVRYHSSPSPRMTPM